jgi:hypothetical protein
MHDRGRAPREHLRVLTIGGALRSDCSVTVGLLRSVSRATRAYFARFKASNVLCFGEVGLAIRLVRRSQSGGRVDLVFKRAKSEAAELARWRSMGRAGFEPAKA